MMASKQVALFCIVGVITTAVDFGVFNLLTRPAAGWRKIPANVVSVSVAMGWSFAANWILVFDPAGGEWLPRAGRFLVITAFSAFVLQNAVLHVASQTWKEPVKLVLLLIRKLGLDQGLGEDVWARNTCKAMAVSAGLVWNFCWYKFFVYAA